MSKRSRPDIQGAIRNLRDEFRRSAEAEGFKFPLPSPQRLRAMPKPDELTEEEWERLCGPNDVLGAIADSDFYMRRRTEWPESKPSFRGIAFKPEDGHRVDHLAAAALRLAWYALQESRFGRIQPLLEDAHAAREPLKRLAAAFGGGDSDLATWFGQAEFRDEASREGIDEIQRGLSAIERAFTRLDGSLWDDWGDGRAIRRRRGRAFWRQSQLERELQAVHATRDVLLSVLDVREVVNLVDDGQGGSPRQRAQRVSQARLDSKKTADSESETNSEG